MADSYLDVVNENDEVIGRELRSVIHRDGLLHREIHVWFITPEKEIIFQKRSATKDTFPNLLDATVGGHVELGQSYQDAVRMEITEETGIVPNMSELYLVRINRINMTDRVTGKHNNVHRAIYGYVYDGAKEALHIEQEDGAGFESHALHDVLSSKESIVKKAIPGLLDETQHPIFHALEKLVS